MTRKKPEELRSHRWFGVTDLWSFGHRSRMKQMGLAAQSDRLVIAEAGGSQCKGIVDAEGASRT